MNNLKINWIQIIKTLILALLICVVIYIISADFIFGPIAKQKHDDQKIEDKISQKHKCEEVYKTTFKYQTYTCENKDEYIIFDINGDKKSSRKKDNSKLVKLNEIIANKYPSYLDAKIRVGYGKNKIAFIIEKDHDFLVIDYDTLKLVFNSEDM